MKKKILMILRWGHVEMIHVITLIVTLISSVIFILSLAL